MSSLTPSKLTAQQTADRDPQAQRARKKAARIAKWGGDDAYSWALFIGGRQAYNGMSRSEASWRRDRYVSTGEL